MKLDSDARAGLPEVGLPLIHEVSCSPWLVLQQVCRGTIGSVNVLNTSLRVVPSSVTTSSCKPHIPYCPRLLPTRRPPRRFVAKGW